jgi:hypothetical protein
MNSHSYPVIPNEDDKRDSTVSNWATEGTTGWEATTNSRVDETSSIVISETLHTAGPGPEGFQRATSLGLETEDFHNELPRGVAYARQPNQTLPYRTTTTNLPAQAATHTYHSKIAQRDTEKEFQAGHSNYPQVLSDEVSPVMSPGISVTDK